MTVVSDRIDEIVHILGGKSVAAEPIKNDLELINLTRRGFRKPTITSVALRLGLTPVEVVKLLGISLDEFKKSIDMDAMNARQSEHLLKLAEIASLGQQLWKDEQYKFHAWLRYPIPAFDGQKPLDLMETMLGAEMVLHVIGRIQHGVFS